MEIPRNSRGMHLHYLEHFGASDYMIISDCLIIIFSFFYRKIADGTADVECSTRLTVIYAELEAIEADTAPSRAAVILSGLGFTPEMQARPTKSFSGG